MNYIFDQNSIPILLSSKKRLDNFFLIQEVEEEMSHYKLEDRVTQLIRFGVSRINSDFETYQLMSEIMQGESDQQLVNLYKQEGYADPFLVAHVEQQAKLSKKLTVSLFGDLSPEWTLITDDNAVRNLAKRRIPNVHLLNNDELRLLLKSRK